MENATIAGYPIVLPSHRAAFHRQNPLWHKAWLDSIHSHLKPDDVVIDVGAEQGDLSALVAGWLPDGGIYLVEPVAGFWPTIRETFSANGLAPPLGTFEGFAAADTSHPITVHSNKWPSSATGEMVEEPGFQHLNERADLPRLKLDDWPFLHTVSGIIVDVEGAELEVLKGAEAVLWDRPTVWCAIHADFMRDRYSQSPKDLLVYMADLGYKAELLDWPGEIHVRFFVENLVLRDGDGNVALHEELPEDFKAWRDKWTP